MNKTLKEVAEKLSKRIKRCNFEEDEDTGEITIYYRRDVLLIGMKDCSWYGYEEFLLAEIKIIDDQNER